MKSTPTRVHNPAIIEWYEYKGIRIKTIMEPVEHDVYRPNRQSRSWVYVYIPLQRFSTWNSETLMREFNYAISEYGPWDHIYKHVQYYVDPPYDENWKEQSSHLEIGQDFQHSWNDFDVNEDHLIYSARHLIDRMIEDGHVIDLGV